MELVFNLEFFFILRFGFALENVMRHTLKDADVSL